MSLGFTNFSSKKSQHNETNYKTYPSNDLFVVYFSNLESNFLSRFVNTEVSSVFLMTLMHGVCVIWPGSDIAHCSPPHQSHQN